MSIGEITRLLREGIFEVLLIAGPMLLAALSVGLIVAILQATTSIQEQTLTFVPKIIAILAVLALLGGWMFSTLGDYTVRLFEMIPEMAR
ncbi:MAG: flagellar biosynthesis protein FliQ [Spirochaetaceae bacterium]|jgi:flagellar biosynthetic protein FliQ|nr:flagellar biosynthesis protein FliQ [Spirochaetaceae bacterium]